MALTFLYGTRKTEVASTMIENLFRSSGKTFPILLILISNCLLYNSYWISNTHLQPEMSTTELLLYSLNMFHSAKQSQRNSCYL
jgi:hypothetical protein